MGLGRGIVGEKVHDGQGVPTRIAKSFFLNHSGLGFVLDAEGLHFRIPPDFKEEIMNTHPLAELPVVFQRLTDPRARRGVRFPYRALCGLVFLGLLARINEMAVLIRWAQAHWDQLREPLGFTRPECPSTNCISRSLTEPSLAEFRQAFAEWIHPFLTGEDCFLALPSMARPVAKAMTNTAIRRLLNVFLHDLKLAISQWQR